MKHSVNKPKAIMLILIVTIIALAGFIKSSDYEPVENLSYDWVAPVSADELKNPFAGKPEATAEGKKLFKQYCSVCHGDNGKGDGPAGMALNPRPADYSTEKIQKQTDGALFWKITEGKSPMASYKNILTEEQRWKLVNYIREFAKK